MRHVWLSRSWLAFIIFTVRPCSYDADISRVAKIAKLRRSTSERDSHDANAVIGGGRKSIARATTFSAKITETTRPFLINEM